MENQRPIDFSAFPGRVGFTLACLLLLGLFAPGAVPVRAAEKAADAGKKVRDYQALLTEYNTRMQDFSRVYQAAKSDEERQKLFETKYPSQEKFAALFLEFVEANPNHSEALDALVWILSNAGHSQEASKALSIVSEKYLRSEKLAPICQSLVYSGAAEREKFLRR